MFELICKICSHQDREDSGEMMKKRAYWVELEDFNHHHSGFQLAVKICVGCTIRCVFSILLKREGGSTGRVCGCASTGTMIHWNVVVLDPRDDDE